MKKMRLVIFDLIRCDKITDNGLKYLSDKISNLKNIISLTLDFGGQYC